MKKVRVESYLQEAQKHKEHIVEAKSVLVLPIKSYEKLNQLQKFALNTLIFRFSKLQDLMGAKIFRAYLEFAGFPTKDVGYFDILKELEKEGVVDIDSWSTLRELRNDIAHDYPDEFDEFIDKINLFVLKSDELIAILNSIEEKYSATHSKRD